MSTTVNHAKAAWATSVVLYDAVFPTCKQQLASSEGTSVQISGAKSELFIGRKSFRLLKWSLNEVKCAHLPEGGCEVDMDLKGSVSANDSDAGTLKITFPDAATLSAEAAQNVKQFICDAELTLQIKNGTSWRVMPKTIPTDTVPWLADVLFSRKQADVVYAHPEDMLEHETMRAVQLPELGKLNLALPVTVATEGLLSVSQLQAVCYAAKSFKHGGGYLLGDGTGCGKGRVIAALLVHVSTRAFSGGPQEIQAEKERRQTQGRERRCLWVSTSRDLMKDAERDLSDLCAEQLGVKLFEAGDDSAGGNIMFVTYAKLRNAETARSIATWLGSNGEGLIVFDEAHSAKNFSKDGSSSVQGRMVDYLHMACPKAPVLYASATACTEVSQMAYMSRLGLWGLDQLFTDFSSFQNTVEGRGLDGMESVALELKARGVAACRSLSHEGISFVVREAAMDSARMCAYDRACAFWRRLQSDAQQTLEEIVQRGASGDTALPIVDACQDDDDVLQDAMGDGIKDDLEELCIRSAQLPGTQFNRFWSAFWACQLRFFRQLVVSLKVPEIKRRADAVLGDRGQAVITLWGTGEAQLACAGLFDDGTQQSGPETMLDQFLLKHFPCPPNGELRTLSLPTKELEDALGGPIEGIERDGDDLSPDATDALKKIAGSTWALPSVSILKLAKLRRLSDESDMWAVDFHHASLAEARRSALRAELQGLQLPQHPLDELLDVLGGPSKVAELSGRTQRLIRGKDQKWSMQPRHADQGPANALNLREQNAFQSGRKRVAIITEAASTGISLHSDRRRLGIGFLPPQRTLIVAELGFSADKTMQQLGRVHRSNQYVQPRYEIILSQVPGEARLAVALARKLKTLGAVTRGDQHGGGLSQAVSSVDMHSDRTVTALHRMSEEFNSNCGADQELAMAFGNLDLGLVSCRSSNDESVSKIVTRCLGRSMMLPLGLQKRLFERIRQYTEKLPTPGSDLPESNSDVTEAVINSDEHISMGPRLPSLRMLRLSVGNRTVVLITGPILSLLILCPALHKTWKLTRFCSREEGSQLCGVVVTEAQLAGITSAANALQAAAAPSPHDVQASAVVPIASTKVDSVGLESNDGKEHVAPESLLKRRKLSNDSGDKGNAMEV